MKVESWTTLRLNPYLTKGGEPLELSMVFNPDPSQLSLVVNNNKDHLSITMKFFKITIPPIEKINNSQLFATSANDKK